MRVILHNQTSYKIFIKIYVANKMVLQDDLVTVIILSTKKFADNWTDAVISDLEIGESSMWMSDEDHDNSEDNMVDVCTVCEQDDIVTALQKIDAPNTKTITIIERQYVEKKDLASLN